MRMTSLYKAQLGRSTCCHMAVGGQQGKYPAQLGGGSCCVITYRCKWAVQDTGQEVAYRTFTIAILKQIKEGGPEKRKK